MKGVNPYFVAVGIIVIALLVASGGQLSQQFSPSASFAATAELITCPSGQTPVTIYDAQKCGTTLLKTNTGTAGICVPYTCRTEVQGERVAYCEVRVKNYLTGGYETSFEMLLPGQSKKFDSFCNADPNGAKWVIEYNLWRNRINSCQVCVGTPTPNECDFGTVTCGSGTEIKTCVMGTQAKPYYHYEILDNCPQGQTCRNMLGGATCTAPCTNDVQCTRSQYCDAGTLSCATQKADGQSCLRDNECLSEACVNGLLGKTCRTVPGKSPGTCQSEDVKTPSDCLACGGTWEDEQGLFGRGWAGLFGGKMRAPECKFGQGFDIGKLPTIFIGSILLSLILTGLLLVVGLVFKPLGFMLRKFYNVGSFIKITVIVALVLMLLFTGMTLQAASWVGL